MKRYAAVRAAFAVLFLISTANSARAQAVASAQIHGVVTDPTGAVVPGAQVKATQTDTRQVRATVTANDGSYVLPNLPVGPYTLEVNIPQFSTYLQSGIILQVGTNVVINVTLQVGSVTQEMRVSENAAMVETEDTSISSVLDQRRIVDLPLNGRQATDLIMLSGGAAVAPNSAGRFVTRH